MFTMIQKHKRLTLQEEQKIINMHENEKLSVTDMAAQFAFEQTQNIFCLFTKQTFPSIFQPKKSNR